ncbi:type VI secretion system-associated protein TagF [Microbulbifer elongatus]|uniref:type VI secretion system-associated protein TagF n=1 Tax=Microbulbifer elongatus TaxID=86173 RepID=UPI001E4ADD74|nr:type VI secretion system-associated protein TagF [Microbulbifer elongatus]
MANKGIFGKLPAHGDFVQRDLPGSFITPWDEWLQRAVHGAREIIGEGWLDYYLTSPIWRFAFSPGVLDGQSWVGVLVPSVDSVGRYFPLTLAAAQPASVNPFTLMTDDRAWFQALSELSIEALQNGLLVDQVLERFPAWAGKSVTQSQGHIALQSASDNSQGLISVSGGGDVEDAYPLLLETLMKPNASSYSLWWCAGSQHLNATSMLCPGLPDPSTYCSMIGAPEYHW